MAYDNDEILGIMGFPASRGGNSVAKQFYLIR
jgi:hypothetical protein